MYGKGTSFLEQLESGRETETETPETKPAKNAASGNAGRKNRREQRKANLALLIQEDQLNAEKRDGKKRGRKQGKLFGRNARNKTGKLEAQTELRKPAQAEVPPAVGKPETEKPENPKKKTGFFKLKNKKPENKKNREENLEVQLNRQNLELQSEPAEPVSPEVRETEPAAQTLSAAAVQIPAGETTSVMPPVTGTFPAFEKTSQTDAEPEPVTEQFAAVEKPVSEAEAETDILPAFEPECVRASGFAETGRETEPEESVSDKSSESAQTVQETSGVESVSEAEYADFEEETFEADGDEPFEPFIYDVIASEKLEREKQENAEPGPAAAVESETKLEAENLADSSDSLENFEQPVLSEPANPAHAHAEADRAVSNKKAAFGEGVDSEAAFPFFMRKGLSAEKTADVAEPEPDRDSSLRPRRGKKKDKSFAKAGQLAFDMRGFFASISISAQTKKKLVKAGIAAGLVCCMPFVFQNVRKNAASKAAQSCAAAAAAFDKMKTGLHDKQNNAELAAYKSYAGENETAAALNEVLTAEAEEPNVSCAADPKAAGAAFRQAAGNAESVADRIEELREQLDKEAKSDLNVAKVTLSAAVTAAEIVYKTDAHAANGDLKQELENRLADGKRLAGAADAKAADLDEAKTGLEHAAEAVKASAAENRAAAAEAKKAEEERARSEEQRKLEEAANSSNNNSGGSSSQPQQTAEPSPVPSPTARQTAEPSPVPASPSVPEENGMNIG